MVKLKFVRGPAVSTVAIVVLVLGATLFDNSYQNVESLLKTKSLDQSDIVLPTHSINYTLHNAQLKEHNVIVIHSKPTSFTVKLEVIEPNGMTFEKESKDGFLYHIIQKSNEGDNYSIKITNTGQESVQIETILAEDPYLSGHCDNAGTTCDAVNLSMGMVVSGIVSFIIGILIGISDFKKERRLKS